VARRWLTASGVACREIADETAQRVAAIQFRRPGLGQRHIAERVDWRFSLPDWILCFWEPRALIRRIEGRYQLAPDTMSERDRITRDLVRALIDHRAAGRFYLRELALQSTLPIPTGTTPPERDTPSTSVSPGDASLEHGDAALRRGQHQLALARYLTIARARPDDAAPWLGVSRVFLVTGQLDRATDVVDRAIALQPRAPEAHSLRATIRRQLGDADGELAALTQAVCCAPDDGVLWDTFIGALEREADAASVLAFIETNRDIIPCTVALTLRQSRLYASVGRADMAERLLTEAQTDSPGAPELSSALALLYLRTDRHAQAIAALERAVASAPRDAELQRTLVAVIENLSGPTAAADHLSRLSRRMPGAAFDLELAVHAARLYMSADRLGDAAAQLHEVIRPGTDADEDPAVALLSSDADRCGRLAQALDHALRLSPGEPRHWHTVLVHLEEIWGPRCAAWFVDRHHALVPADPALDLRIARLCTAVGCIGPGLLQALRRVTAPELSDAAAKGTLGRFLEDLQRGAADDKD